MIAFTISKRYRHNDTWDLCWHPRRSDKARGQPARYHEIHQVGSDKELAAACSLSKGSLSLKCISSLSQKSMPTTPTEHLMGSSVSRFHGSMILEGTFSFATETLALETPVIWQVLLTHRQRLFQKSCVPSTIAQQYFLLGSSKKTEKQGFWGVWFWQGFKGSM